jgi:type IV pilus assembly protein PilB
VVDAKRKPLGQILKEMKLVSESQIQEALAIQKQRGGVIGKILVNLGYISEAEVNVALGKQAGIEAVDLDDMDIPPEIIERVSPSIASTYRIVPVTVRDGKLIIAMADPFNVKALDDLRFLLDSNIEPVVSNEAAVGRAIEKYYSGQTESAEDVMKEMDESAIANFDFSSDEVIDIENIEKMADAAPVRRLLSYVLLHAIRDKASDIHFEPFEDEFKIRYRIDGALYEMVPPPKPLGLALTSRIKVLANLNIAERRIAQDGRIDLNVGGNQVDLRVSILPTIYGESCVLRVLDRSNVSLDLDRLGLREDDLKLFRTWIHKPNGIVLVTGPTGSGKTTTLYSALNEINNPTDKIITTEDPVEYDLEGVIQVQVHPEYDVTFANCLRAILRQDPDIILVGEIRDLETAEIAIQASLTGHLVFTTLHTNDAPSAITRLIDMNVEPYLITATVEGIQAQRLVRKICLHCREQYDPSEDVLAEMQLKPADVKGKKFYFGRGCEYCNKIGYKGRMAIIELLVIDDELRALIMEKASTSHIRQIARRKGMRTLRESGILAVFDGMTTVEEVLKETVMEEED